MKIASVTALMQSRGEAKNSGHDVFRCPSGQGVLMSRGPGWLQHFLVRMIRDSKPKTFAQIRALMLQDGGVNDPGARLRPSVERSMRRSLKRLCDDGVIVAIGEGGRGDPHRYCFNPMVIAMQGDKEEFNAATAMVEAEPGGPEALNKSARRMFK
jgi:hypothetical protein